MALRGRGPDGLAKAARDAILAKTTVTPGKLSLGESQAGPARRSLTLTNHSATAVTYRLSHVDGTSTSGVPYTPEFTKGGRTSSSARAVSPSPAGGQGRVNVTITAPATPQLGQYGGYLVLIPSQGQPLRVPFAGFVGDDQRLPVFTDGGGGFPQLAKVMACERLVVVRCTLGAVYEKASSGATSSMSKADFPTVARISSTPRRRSPSSCTLPTATARPARRSAARATTQ